MIHRAIESKKYISKIGEEIYQIEDYLGNFEQPVHRAGLVAS